jgi:hypothetical protein
VSSKVEQTYTLAAPFPISYQTKTTNRRNWNAGGFIEYTAACYD